MELNKKSVRTLIMLIAFAVIAAWALFRPAAIAAIWQGLAAIMTPFVLGVTIAFLVNLLLRPLEAGWDRLLGWGGGRRGRWLAGMKRPVSILLSVVLIAVAMFVLLFIVLPEVAKTIILVAEMVPQYASHVDGWWQWIDERLAGLGLEVPRPDLRIDDLAPMVSDWLAEQGPAVLGKTLGFTTSVVTGVFNVVIGLVLGLYILADKERLLRQTRRVLQAFLPEERVKTIVDVADLTNTTFSKFVTGQLTDAFIVGVLCYIFMLVTRMPYAGAASVVVGVTTIVPVIGVLIGTVVAAFLILVVDPVKAFWFVVFIVVLQQVESNVIYPRVVGKSVGLPGLWVLAAISVGGATFGVLGMLLAVPTFSVLYTLLRRAVNRRLADKEAGGAVG